MVLTAPPTHEEALHAAAAEYVAKVAKSAVAPASSERGRYLAKVFAPCEPEPAPTSPLPPANPAYDRLMAKAEKLHKADPSKTVEQHFETVFTDPINVELAKRAARAAATVRQEGKTNVDPQSEDDLDDAEIDPNDVEDDTDDDEDDIGPGPDTDAASPTNRGLSEAPYNADGDNLRQNPRPAVVGQVEGSYDPRRRPDSATRKSLDTAVEKRVLKYMARNPSASRVEATAWATRGRKVQRLVNAS